MTQAQWEAQKQAMLQQCTSQINYWQAKVNYYQSVGGSNPTNPYYPSWLTAKEALERWTAMRDSIEAKVYPEPLV